MSKVWETLIEIQLLLEESFEQTGVEVFEPGMDRFNQPGWVNRVWTSNKYRRAHIDVVDARLTKGLWMMHCCIYKPSKNHSCTLSKHSGRNQQYSNRHNTSTELLRTKSEM